MIRGFDKTIDWYNAHAEEYATTLSDKPRLDNMEKFLQYLPPRSTILDAGCAGGRDAHIFATKGYNVTGVDISSGLIAHAQKFYPSITFLESDFLRLPLKDEIFDGVWAHASLVHLPTDEAAQKTIQEFARVLKRGGVLYVYVKQQVGNEKTSLKTDSYATEERFFRYYSREELQEYFRNAGFEILTLYSQPDLERRPGVSWVLAIGKKL